MFYTAKQLLSLASDFEEATADSLNKIAKKKHKRVKKRTVVIKKNNPYGGQGHLGYLGYLGYLGGLARGYGGYGHPHHMGEYHTEIVDHDGDGIPDSMDTSGDDAGDMGGGSIGGGDGDSGGGDGGGGDGGAADDMFNFAKKKPSALKNLPSTRDLPRNKKTPMSTKEVERGANLEKDTKKPKHTPSPDEYPRNNKKPNFKETFNRGDNDSAKKKSPKKKKSAYYNALLSKFAQEAATVPNYVPLPPPKPPASINVHDLPDASIDVHDLPDAPAVSSAVRTTRNYGTETERKIVEGIQKYLNDNKFNAGLVDGKLGNQTSTALKRWQKSVQLPETGQLDKATWTKFSEIIPEMKMLATQTASFNPQPFEAAVQELNKAILPYETAIDNKTINAQNAHLSKPFINKINQDFMRQWTILLNTEKGASEADKTLINEKLDGIKAKFSTVYSRIVKITNDLNSLAPTPTATQAASSTPVT